MSLQRLYGDFGVSPWLDDLSRELIDSGQLYNYAASGIRGLTSNPTIFANAIVNSDSYTSDIKKLASDGLNAEQIYWELAIKDVRDAADVLRPIYDSSNGQDGYVSLEVNPLYAHDSAKTITQARNLWRKVRRANLMIKVPATKEGLQAITKLTSEGINVNVTLIFSLTRYLQVMNAYQAGLEKRDGGLRQIHSVASFFVSRVDTAIDHLLEKHLSHESEHFVGRSALAQSWAAYGLFLETFNPTTERWGKLASRGANIQRPLWASTSTKNPDYDPLLYVKYLLLPSTVNTMPIKTIELVDRASSRTWERPTESYILDSHQLLGGLKNIGVDLKKVTDLLERDGVKKFAESFKEIISSIEQRLQES